MCSEEKLTVEQQLALEERKLVQNIINQQEDASFKIRSWAVALFSGMTLIHTREASNFSSDSYLGTVFLILVVFLILEIRHIIAFFKLVESCDKLESLLKFQIQSSLSKEVFSFRRCKLFDNINGLLKKMISRCEWCNDISGLLKKLRILRQFKDYCGIRKVKIRYIEILFVYFVFMVVSIFIA